MQPRKEGTVLTSNLYVKESGFELLKVFSQQSLKYSLSILNFDCSMTDAISLLVYS